MRIPRTRQKQKIVVRRTTPNIYHFDGTWVNAATIEGPHVVSTKLISDFYNKQDEVESIPDYLNPSDLLIVDWKSSPTVTVYDRYFDTARTKPYVIGAQINDLGSSLLLNLESACTPREPSRSELLSLLVSRTAPDRYDASLPVMVVELLEIMTTFRIVTNNFVSLAGSGYLSYNFGIAPFLEDVRSLFQVLSKIESRMREFNSLIGKGGLSRHSQLFTEKFSTTQYGIPYATNAGRWMICDYVRSYEINIWGTLRWFPKDADEIPTDEFEKRMKAFRLILDLDNPSWDTVWEAIPFSWLIDYFVSIGPALANSSTFDAYVPKHTCLMYDRTVTHTRENIREQQSRPDVWPVFDGKSTLRSRRRYALDTDLVVSSATAPGFGGLLSASEATNIIALMSRLTTWKDLVSSVAEAASKYHPFKR
jgi:hypothetical protein